MLALRRDVSVLLSEGHSHSRLYPIIMLWNEAELARERRRTQWQMMMNISSAVINASNTDISKRDRKELGKALQDMFRDISDGIYG